MKCPICQIDLSPLDLVSRTEHVEYCVENKVVSVSEDGQVVVKSNVPLGKQRIICPICDKSFQTITGHFKTCCLKNDVPPYLMLDYWEQINKGAKNPKKFPYELLDAFVAKWTKEGRFGEQLEMAKALLLSMAQSDSKGFVPQSLQSVDETSTSSINNEMTSMSSDRTSISEQHQHQQISSVEGATSSISSRNGVQLLMQQQQRGPVNISAKSRAKRYRIELVDEPTRQGHIRVRIDREVAATRRRRYEEALREEQIAACLANRQENNDDEECQIIQDETVTKTCNSENDLAKLFFRARLKDCDGSELCRKASCTGHDLAYFIEGFEAYSGRSMDEPVREGPINESVVEKAEN